MQIPFYVIDTKLNLILHRFLNSYWKIIPDIIRPYTKDYSEGYIVDTILKPTKLDDLSCFIFLQLKYGRFINYNLTIFNFLNC